MALALVWRKCEEINSAILNMLINCILIAEVVDSGKRRRFFMEKAWSVDRLMERMRDVHGFEDLKGNIGIDMYMKIVGSGDEQKLAATERFVANF